VKKYAGAAGVARLRELRQEIRGKEGGNIVKGPKADELKRRLQEEGLLPTGKPKSMDAGQLFQQQLQAKAPSVPPELKEQLKQLEGPTNRPDSKYGGLADDQLKDRLGAARAVGGKDWSQAQKIEKELKRRGIDPDAKSEPRPKGMEKWDMDQMKRIDTDVTLNTTAREGKSGYDWNDSLGKDAKLLGAGAFGTAILGGNGDVVKRGEIGEKEAKIIEKVGKLGLGPKLISAELDGPGYNDNTKKGRLAMSKVEGEPIENRKGPEISNAYWDARAKLHRAGVAHNDMHIQNVLVDKTGKGRFVDMGLAQDNPKAALAEAMGIFSTPIPGTARIWRANGARNEGDWQAQRYENIGGPLLKKYEKQRLPEDWKRLESEHPNVAKVYMNRGAAINRLRRMGLTDQEVTDIMYHGIRSKDSSFEQGAMGKLTNDQAKQIIEVLYDGI
jgi:hypothetical protein